MDQSEAYNKLTKIIIDVIQSSNDILEENLRLWKENKELKEKLKQ